MAVGGQASEQSEDQAVEEHAAGQALAEEQTQAGTAEGGWAEGGETEGGLTEDAQAQGRPPEAEGEAIDTYWYRCPMYTSMRVVEW
ncbi:hypothetical protein AB1Y20_011136 [Prymnesium parvum]|uniref:Uncharacterized protein n=1 Tax=Prymnesium parvum TaxID=97485 RepID=A0AB34IKZ7_PRYPA